jgi:hypothetical protein
MQHVLKVPWPRYVPVKHCSVNEGVLSRCEMCIEHGGQKFEQFEQFPYLLVATFRQRWVVRIPLKTRRTESAFLSNAPRFPKEHCFLEGFCRDLRTPELMLFSEIIAVCFNNYTKRTNALCGQNVEFVNVKPGGTYSNHWALEGEILYLVFIKISISR